MTEPTNSPFFSRKISNSILNIFFHAESVAFAEALASKKTSPKTISEKKIPVLINKSARLFSDLAPILVSRTPLLTPANIYFFLRFPKKEKKKREPPDVNGRSIFPPTERRRKRPCFGFELFLLFFSFFRENGQPVNFPGREARKKGGRGEETKLLCHLVVRCPSPRLDELAPKNTYFLYGAPDFEFPGFGAYMRLCGL